MSPSSMNRHRKSSSSPGTALTAVTSAAPGDSRLSAPVNSHLVKVKSWCIMRPDSSGGLRGKKGPGVNSSPSVVSAASVWTKEVIRARSALIPGPWPPIDTHQNTDAKQISISQYSLPASASGRRHPERCHVYLTSGWDNRDNGSRDGTCLHWVLSGWGAEYSHLGSVCEMASEFSLREIKC